MGRTRWHLDGVGYGFASLAVCVALVLAQALGAEAQTSAAVQLSKPDVLHSDGAELEWSRFDTALGTFSAYEVHRSATAGFTPSASTRLASIPDIEVTSFRDTTAAAGKPFSYKVVASGATSNEQTVTLPAQGQATMTLQPAGTSGTATWVADEGSPSLNCANWGVADSMWVGAEPGTLRHALVDFDLRRLPAKSTVSSATLSLYRNVAPRASITVNVHRATREWLEGSASGTCSGDGASWIGVQAGVPWSKAGGDFDSAVEASKALTTKSAAGWDDFSITSLAQSWANVKRPALGLVLKAADETRTTGKAVTYLTDDYADATKRPKLTLAFSDDSRARGPRVELAAPGKNEQVSGNAVKLAASAGDDRRVEKVEFLVDGAVVATLSAAPYTTTWNSTAVANGTKSLTVRATDDAGNQTTSAAVSVSVDNSAAPSTTVTSPSNKYKDQTKADKPAGYWRFNELPGVTTASDSSGNNRSATYGGSFTLAQPGLLTGDGDQAANFNNATTDGRTTSTAFSGLLGSRLTAEAWVDYAGFATHNTENWVASRGWGSSGGWLVSVFRDAAGAQGVKFTLNQSGVIGGVTSPITPGRNHIVGTYDGSNVRLYLNGLEVTNVAQPGLTFNTSASLLVANTLATNLKADEIAVYDRPLTAEEIRSHYEVGQNQPVTVEGTRTVSADASDDRGVTRVEFYADGVRYDEDTSAPFTGSWNTTAAGAPVYDGTHELTTKAYDASGQVQTSAPVTVTVDNTVGTKFQADLSSTEPPPVVTYDPAVPAQEKSGVDVTVTNRSGQSFSTSDVVLRPRWISLDANPATVTGADVPLTADLAAGASATMRALLEPPTLADGVDQARYQLVLDLYSKSSSAFFSEKGNKPVERPVTVRKKTPVGLGLERYYHYDGLELGAGMQQLVNLASGNSILRWTPFSSPGRGLATVVDLTYNGLEKTSQSPVGNNFSLAMSGLTRFGEPIDVHPNKADEIAGRAPRYVEITDGDGTVHRFVGKQDPDGGIHWEEPAGTHLYLRVASTTDPTRKWAFTRPDRTTFYYDEDGYPTGVEDLNGNRLAFTLETTPPGEDPGGPKKRVVKVTDAAGTVASPAPNRSFAIEYFSKAEAKKAQVRGKIKRISDHTGSALDFSYYEDGNLLRLTQRGGLAADGGYLADRSFVFTYTTPNGDGPAIPLAADRVNPEPKTSSQSSRLFSVRDPRGNETTFAYFDTGNDKWKLRSRTDRSGRTTSYAYAAGTRTTTVTAPLSRVSQYAFDPDGQILTITNPKNEQTGIEWSPDRHVAKVTEPNGRFTTFKYNANGQLSERTDQLSHTTQIAYQDFQVDGNDVPGERRTGQDIGHISQPSSKTDPRGVASTTVAGDYQWSFGYDPRGNLTQVTDPEEQPTTYGYNSDGTLATITDANTHTTSFENYDANGLPQRVVDAKQQVTQQGFDDDGLLRWIQDPLHASATGTDPREYRTYLDYDAFHRPGRQSTPKSTEYERGRLIWTSVEFDANDNVTTDNGPDIGYGYTAGGARTTTSYDAMDRQELVTGPDRTVDPNGERVGYRYDAAGRLDRITRPKGVATTATDTDFATDLEYDLLDRVLRRIERDGSANRITHYCYGTTGDLLSTTAPKANLPSVNCGIDGAPLGTSHTNRRGYDDAHRLITVQDPEGGKQTYRYDENDNVTSRKDEQDFETTIAYDERNLPVEITEPFNGADTNVTRLAWDNVGNRKRLISPRAYDSSADKQTFTRFVTSFGYDAADQLTRVDLPIDPTDPKDNTPLYAHRGYDANGNLRAVSLPTDVADPGSGSTLPSIPASAKTTLTVFDPGWIRTSNDPANPRVRYDYSAEGWQTSRRPDGGKPQTRGYYLDGMLREERARDGQATAYGYDAHNNLVDVSDATGVNAPSEQPMEVTVAYDDLDRATKTRQRKVDQTNYLATSTNYDANGNAETRTDDTEETPTGTEVKAGRRHEFTYDQADRLTQDIDRGTSTANDDDKQIITSYLPGGWRRDRTVNRRNTSGAFELRQKTSWTYYENELVRTLKTVNQAGTLVESHDLTYVNGTGSAATYVNGNPVRDVVSLRGPKAGAPCKDPQTDACVNLFTYDGRDRLIEERRQRSTGEKWTKYTLDAPGNVRFRDRNNGEHVEFRYDGNQLTDSIENGTTLKYRYDAEGNLDCITTTALGSCPKSDGYVPGLARNYRYDRLNRMLGYRSWDMAGNSVDETSYTHDALDRPVRETERHDGGAKKTTLMSYIGLSTDISREEQRDGADETATLIKVKSYGYDPFGQRLTLTHENKQKGTAPKEFSYVQDPQGSTSLLLDANGDAKAQYGYLPYGEQDNELTKENDPDAATPDADPAANDPLNAYRYTDKRLDTGSGTLDMGARRFDAGSAHFLQQDRYDGALDNLGLAGDPLTQNRYALAGGNPVSFVESDGHEPISSFKPQGKQIIKNIRPASTYGNDGKSGSGDAPATDRTTNTRPRGADWYHGHPAGQPYGGPVVGSQGKIYKPLRCTLCPEQKRIGVSWWDAFFFIPIGAKGIRARGPGARGAAGRVPERPTRPAGETPNRLGAAREEHVAEVTGGSVSRHEIVQEGVGRTDVDVVGPNGEYIAVGGPAKAKSPSDLGQKLSILRRIAEARNVRAVAFFEKGTPEAALRVARRQLGEGNVYTFSLPPG